MKVVIPSTACRAKKCLFRPLEASNGSMTKPFELGELQMILSDLPMSDSSGATRVGQSSEFGKNGLKTLIPL